MPTLPPTAITDAQIMEAVTATLDAVVDVKTHDGYVSVDGVVHTLRIHTPDLYETLVGFAGKPPVGYDDRRAVALALKPRLEALVACGVLTRAGGTKPKPVPGRNGKMVTKTYGRAVKYAPTALVETSYAAAVEQASVLADQVQARIEALHDRGDAVGLGRMRFSENMGGTVTITLDDFERLLDVREAGK